MKKEIITGWAVDDVEATTRDDPGDRFKIGDTARSSTLNKQGFVLATEHIPSKGWYLRLDTFPDESFHQRHFYVARGVTAETEVLAKALVREREKCRDLTVQYGNEIDRAREERDTYHRALVATRALVEEERMRQLRLADIARQVDDRLERDRFMCAAGVCDRLAGLFRDPGRGARVAIVDRDTMDPGRREQILKRLGAMYRECTSHEITLDLCAVMDALQRAEEQIESLQNLLVPRMRAE